MITFSEEAELQKIEKINLPAAYFLSGSVVGVY